MARVTIDVDLVEYIRNNGTIDTNRTTYDDRQTKIRMYREYIDGHTYLTINELFIPGSTYHKGVALIELIKSIVFRCTHDNMRLRFTGVYNENLIRRLQGWGMQDVTPPGQRIRQFQTDHILQADEFRNFH